MNEQIKREERVHGKHWGTLHGGYFSDPEIASPLIQTVREFAKKSGVDALVDLGGGTGALLSLLLAEGIDPNIALINLDASDAQLEIAAKNGLSCVRGSVNSFLRGDAGADEDTFLFMMRSVLHYFGQEGLGPVLRHIRTQMQPGEYFVHQTASFRHQHDADFMNELYQCMRTPKWYPTVDNLCDCLSREQWRVLEVLPGPPLPLPVEELQMRYDLSNDDLLRIHKRLSRLPDASQDVFKKTENGFCAALHYWIYVCTPAIPGAKDNS
jgi:SAM-dependent methyltransferase